jgi:hypothetical protein
MPSHSLYQDFLIFNKEMDESFSFQSSNSTKVRCFIFCPLSSQKLVELTFNIFLPLFAPPRSIQVLPMLSFPFITLFFFMLTLGRSVTHLPETISLN